ncbi:MAG: hypothetical protein BWY45_01867 [Euryarchaeota archaeon ADurb.Bin294]|nr:MAG: hypothetical protein BWY45_01867 [Euryarchaeota archaeon ADurb.Bin294]
MTGRTSEYSQSDSRSYFGRFSKNSLNTNELADMIRTDFPDCNLPGEIDKSDINIWLLIFFSCFYETMGSDCIFDISYYFPRVFQKFVCKFSPGLTKALNVAIIYIERAFIRIFTGQFIEFFFISCLEKPVPVCITVSNLNRFYIFTWYHEDQYYSAFCS